MSPGLPGTEVETPEDTAKRCWLAVHSTDLPWGVTSLNPTVPPGTWVRAVPWAAVLTCLPRSTHPGPDSCWCPIPMLWLRSVRWSPSLLGHFPSSPQCLGLPLNSEGCEASPCLKNGAEAFQLEAQSRKQIPPSTRREAGGSRGRNSFQDPGRKCWLGVGEALGGGCISRVGPKGGSWGYPGGSLGPVHLRV